MSLRSHPSRSHATVECTPPSLPTGSGLPSCVGHVWHLPKNTPLASYGPMPWSARTFLFSSWLHTKSASW